MVIELKLKAKAGEIICIKPLSFQQLPRETIPPTACTPVTIHTLVQVTLHLLPAHLPCCVTGETSH